MKSSPFTATKLLFVLAAASAMTFACWQALLNNFAVEQVGFTGVEIGVLQSVREVPGFLAFTVVWVLLLVRQQTFSLASLALLGLGTVLAGFFPSVIGLYITTVVMSAGFHYLETMQTALALQWLPKGRAAVVMGQLLAIRSLAGLASLGVLYLCLWSFDIPYLWLHAAAGSIAILVAIAAGTFFPRFPEQVEQRKELFMRRRYWLYYLLTFFAGARRQIFVVFAAFLLVEKFAFPVEMMVLLFLVNAVMTTVLAPLFGRLIAHWGERNALSLEYGGLIIVFTGYAFVDTAWIAVALYLVDHVFFSMAIAIKTYFQKIADPADIAATSGISFTINHVAAVVLPALLGVVWVTSPSAVFLTGSTFAIGSLLLAQLIPDDPAEGREIRRSPIARPSQA
ncbi:MAG: MFS transporter [Pseudomonadales bacterium]